MRDTTSTDRPKMRPENLERFRKARRESQLSLYRRLLDAAVDDPMYAEMADEHLYRNPWIAEEIGQ